MTWSTLEIEYEGFPLLLRRPNYENIWQYKERFSQLVSVEHQLTTVSGSGLPGSNYNKALEDFDSYMCDKFINGKKGIILLIETFAGKRNYYYYTELNYNVNSQFKEVKEQFLVNLTAWHKLDLDWGFLDKYPIVVFEK